jgi:hypothetical protein
MKTEFSRARRSFSTESFRSLRSQKLWAGFQPAADLSEDGSLAGRSLLESCISGDPQIPARRGTTLRPLSTSSVAQIKQIWGQGAAAIKGVQLGDNDANTLQFGACRLHGGAELFRLTPKMDPIMMQTFVSVVESMKIYGYKTRLSRFDLFHAHLFRTSLLSRYALIGMLFHCAEFPAINSTKSTSCSAKSGSILKDINLGFCQQDSTCEPSLEEWRFRNVVWSTWWDLSETDFPALQSSFSEEVSHNQVIWLLDGASPDIHKLRIDGSEFGPGCPNAVYEGYLGETLGEVICVNDQLYFTN